MCEKLHARASNPIEPVIVESNRRFDGIVDGTMQRRSAFMRMLMVGLGLAASRKALANPVCDFCDEEIEGRYMVYKTSKRRVVMCSDCDKKYPKCDACRMPHLHKDILLQRGERLCRECAADAKYCNGCAKRITGRYYQINPSEEDAEKGVEAQLFCARCYSRTPKCKVCGKPTPRSRIELASGACLDCIEKLDRCNSCGTFITGRYYEFEHADGKYCERCKRDKPGCYTCGVPVGNKYWKFPDGRSVCQGCHSRSVTDPKQIEKIWIETKGLMKKHLNMHVEHEMTLNIEALNATSISGARNAKKGLSTQSPLFGSELGLYRYINGKADVYLLYGLPIEMIYETAAHEYAHGWQVENCPPNQSLELKEGFAQWAAAQILKVKGFDAALEKLEDRDDPHYGRGYKRFKQVEDRLGRDGVFRYAKTQLR